MIIILSPSLTGTRESENLKKKLKTLQTGFGFLDRPHVTGRKLNEAHTVSNE
jgi:hypothetical protein